MSSQDGVSVGTDFRSVEDVIEGLARLEEGFLAARDRRGVFATAYLQITHEIVRWIEDGRFHDGGWVARYLVAFANLYRQALAAYMEGDRAGVPEAWRISLDASAAGSGLVIQDLLLGINAHINHDLPLALWEVGIEPDRTSRYEDHTAVNTALRQTTDRVQERIAAMYASGLGVLDRLLGNLDEDFSSFGFQKGREHAWNMGVALVNARTEEEARLLDATIDSQAVLVGRLVLAPNTPFPWLIDAMAAVERIEPWWEHVGATPAAVRLAARPAVAGGPRAVGGPAPAAAPPVESLDEVIDRLGDLISGFDRERSRLSIYPTVYRRITRRVKEVVESGGFQDPAWMTRLDLRFADRYFRILDLYLAGRLDEIPRSWAFALEAVREGRTMVVQDIALQITPRVVYDLPLTLPEAGLDGDLDKRHHDYEKTYELFTSELDDIQRMVAEKYSRLVTFMDVLGGRLDEVISDVLYTRARKEAWSDGMALHAESSEERRRELTRLIDRKAVHSANKALFFDFPPATFMARAVRELEDAFTGSWSELIDAPD